MKIIITTYFLLFSAIGFSQDTLTNAFEEIQKNLDYLKAKVNVQNTLSECNIENQANRKEISRLDEQLRVEKIKNAELTKWILEHNSIDLYFSSGSSELSKESIAILEMYLTNNLTAKLIIIEGHADEEGNASSNILLSKNRAQQVKQKILDLKLISTPELSIKEFGSAQPKCSNRDSESCNFLNRRVTLKLVQ